MCSRCVGGRAERPINQGLSLGSRPSWWRRTCWTDGRASHRCEPSWRRSGPRVRRTSGFHQPVAVPRCGAPRASHGAPAAPGASSTVMPQVRLTSPRPRATVYITLVNPSSTGLLWHLLFFSPLAPYPFLSLLPGTTFERFLSLTGHSFHNQPVRLGGHTLGETSSRWLLDAW